MTLVATLAVLLALGLDRLVGEPPARAHPVAIFGRIAELVDREWSRPRLVGALTAVILPLVTAGLAGGLVALAGRAGSIISPRLGAVAALTAAGAVLFSTTSLRMLVSEAAALVAWSETDITRARTHLEVLAGRDPSDLSPGQLRSAAVESAAENLADGLVGPLLAFALLAFVSLPTAAAAAVWVKAVNTLDSMFGYPDNPLGGPSARLDDLVMWLPARTTAVLLALTARDPDALWVARKWAGNPPSPNAGWPMAVMAGLLHVRLEKPGVYVLNRMGGLPATSTAEHGLRTVRTAGILAFLGTAGVVLWS